MGDERNKNDDSTRLTASGVGDETRFTTSPASRPSAGGEASTLAPGSLLGHTYRIEALLARGGMGEVYRARHSELNTEHAIKIILPELANNPRIVDLFRREASVLRTVRNDAVVAYDGVFRDENGRLYLVMEFVEGTSLSKVYKQRPLGTDEARQLLDRLADGLAAAHEKGVIHRDISPDNIILPGRDLSQAKIIDFGISKMADPEAKTIVGDDFAGKYSYVSPEQLGMFGGEVDGRSDIYSLGLVLAAAAIGEPLDMGMSPISVIEARRGVPDLGRVPADLRRDLEAMLQPDPSKRPQSMRELIREPVRPKQRRDGRRPVVDQKRQTPTAMKPGAATARFGVTQIVAALAVLVVLGGGAGYWFLLRPGGQGTTTTTTAAVPSTTVGSATAASTPPSTGSATSPGTATSAPSGQTAQDFINALTPPASQGQSGSQNNQTSAASSSAAASPPSTSVASPPAAASPPSTIVAADLGQSNTASSGTALQIGGASGDATTETPSATVGQPVSSAAPTSTDGTPAATAGQIGAASQEQPVAAGTAVLPGTTPPAASGTTQTAMLPVAPDVAKLAADARRAVQDLTCSQVRIDVAENGDATASGYVGTEADIQRAVAEIAAVPGMGSVTNGIVVMKRPLCDALGVLAAQAALDQPAAPRLDPGGAAGVYREGDHLRVGATATAAFDGYLYVDYYDAAERYVVHLLPNELRPDNRVKAGQQVVIGTLPEEMKNYTVSPPFGTNMVVAMSSPRPLFTSRRALLEQADDYLPALRKALQSVADQVGQGKLLAASTSVIFEAR